jgi:pilus assembly protein CpaC
MTVKRVPIFDHWATWLWLIGLICLLPFEIQAQSPPPISVETTTPKALDLIKGKSVVLNSHHVIKRVSLADPEVADTHVISPKQLYVTGKTIGATNLTLWDPNDRVSAIFDVHVAPQTTQLKQRLHDILPGESIRVVATHDVITLSGNVSSKVKLQQALEIAEAYMPKKVINLMQVSGVNQVMLEVRVAEMARSLTRRLGFNFSVFKDGSHFGLSLLNNLTSLSDTISGDSPFGLNVSQAVNSLLRFGAGGTTITAFLDALKENGLAKILAEPTLVTLSGQEASFLAGGEFPIPVSQRSDSVTVEYKTFGVALQFTPNVIDQEKISIRVAPEVSDLDFSNAVTLTGFVIPALTTRRAATMIELRDGQSFAIAGLLNQTVREVISKLPVLGEIPILGALFRSSSFQKDETELVIIVTPHLVKPLDMEAQTLPTDQFVEPNDFEFYLFGRTEGFGSGADMQGSLDGQFGYILQQEHYDEERAQ